MSYVAVAGAVYSIWSGNKATNEAKERARAERRRARKEADLEEKDLFAEYEASIEQQRDALAKMELAETARAEALRVAQMARQDIDVDLAGGALDAQERAARRRSFFEDDTL